jgi:hypothetical protein
MPLLPPASTDATIDNAAISAIGSIPSPLPSTTTAIATINDRHCRCHTVNDDNCQKPENIVCHQRQLWQSLLTKTAVNGGRGNGGLEHRWQWDGGTMMQWHPRQWHL